MENNLWFLTEERPKKRSLTNYISKVCQRLWFCSVY